MTAEDGLEREGAAVTCTDLVAECLRWIVNNDCAREIPTEYAQVFDIITIHTDTVFSEQPVPEQLYPQIRQLPIYGLYSTYINIRC